MDSVPRHSCLRLDVGGGGEEEVAAIFVKGTWFDSHFDLDITDGLQAWTCKASEAEVRERAEQWDQPVPEYVDMAERYLGFQQPSSVYRFEDAGKGQRRLSWTFEKQGIKLEWRWKCQPSPDKKQTTVQILDFLMDANIRLSEEVVTRTQLSEKLKTEAEKCLAQSEKFSNEKTEFESVVYGKFVAVLNSKKVKLRALRDRLSKFEAVGKAPQDEDESTDKSESCDDGSNNDLSKEETVNDLPGSLKLVATSSSRGRKRKYHQ